MIFKPGYLNLLRSGKLSKRTEHLRARLESCDICPQHCGVDRLGDETGHCGIGSQALVSSYGPHFGEETPLRGRRGSGTIFFSGCSLDCVYCQNAAISQHASGNAVSSFELAEMMLDLQSQGCHNINLVTPSHVVPQILAALETAARQGLSIPLVYNTGGYDSVHVLELLEGVVDIYMPDMKYADQEAGQKYSGVPDYPTVNQNAVLEMHRQVGDLQISKPGTAEKGLLIRHLVLPNDRAGTSQILEFISEKISRSTYLNLMDQYRPAYLAARYPELDRPLSSAEYLQAVSRAKDLGLNRRAR